MVKINIVKKISIEGGFSANYKRFYFINCRINNLKNKHGFKMYYLSEFNTKSNSTVTTNNCLNGFVYKGTEAKVFISHFKKRQETMELFLFILKYGF